MNFSGAVGEDIRPEVVVRVVVEETDREREGSISMWRWRVETVRVERLRDGLMLRVMSRVM